MQKCQFFTRVGTCRHGDNCSKGHTFPTTSNTLLLKNVYFYPLLNPESTLGRPEIQKHADLFYEDIFTEISLKYAPIRNMLICANSSDHLIGNVYIEFYNNCDFEIDRFYNYKRIISVPTHIRFIKDAVCSENSCDRGDFCNFLHPIEISKQIVDDLFESQRLYYENKNIFLR
ncbi:Splicing factor U2AF 35 kDa subunit [Dictyocoela roeselum]|nr:Splicing factor U2AF 35 kDa subunit [Dictyocoela roeselum]